MFDSRLSYVALGHLHRPQEVGSSRIRYSGSPLPLSFSETDYPHQVVLIELHGDELREARAISVPRFAQLLRLPTAAATLDVVVATLAAHDFSTTGGVLPPYLEVLVEMNGPEPGMRVQIEEALADKPVRLAKISTSCASDATSAREMVSVDDLRNLGRRTSSDNCTECAQGSAAFWHDTRLSETPAVVSVNRCG